MPPKLKKAHQELDKAVDRCYDSRSFKSDKERIEFLFGLGCMRGILRRCYEF